MGSWEASNRLARIRLEEAQDINAEEIYSTCPCCEFQLIVGADKNNITTTVKDLTDIVLQGMGEIPSDNPTQRILHIWNQVFEPAILFMSPQRLNEMMSKMTPELMAAMPRSFKIMFNILRVSRLGYIMSPLLGVIGKLPWIIPTMFRLMLPGMLPKMLPEIKEYMFLAIPGLNKYPQMKDRMEYVLPYTMGKLLPTMLPKMMPELKPIAVKAMQDYMKGNLEAIGSFSTKVTPIIYS
jgi:hypothetical protein